MQQVFGHTNEKNQCAHATLLLVRGSDDDASLRWLHRDIEDIFGVGKVADSPLKVGLCIFTCEDRLRKQKGIQIYFIHVELVFSLKGISVN